MIADLVIALTTELFNTLGASSSKIDKKFDRFLRNARLVSPYNSLIYKKKVIGDWVVNRMQLPFVWHIGNEMKNNRKTTHRLNKLKREKLS